MGVSGNILNKYTLNAFTMNAHFLNAGLNHRDMQWRCAKEGNEGMMLRPSKQRSPEPSSAEHKVC